MTTQYRFGLPASIPFGAKNLWSKLDRHDQFGASANTQMSLGVKGAF